MLADSSITRIVHRIVLLADKDEFCWYVCPVTQGGDFEDVFAQMGAQLVKIPNREKGTWNLSRAVGAYALENGIDIIHTHTPRTILMAWLALRGRKQVKHLTTKHLLTTSSDRKLGFLVAQFDRMSLALPDRVIAVSEQMGKSIRSFSGVRKDRVSVIQNAIPVNQFFYPDLREECREEFQVASNALLIGYTGRIDKVKRIDLLLSAFCTILERYPNSVLLIAGEGKLQPQMKDLAQQMGIAQSVRWTGFRHDIPRLLAGVDIFVQPSINEGLSLSLLEAMAAKKAVIATKVGGTEEIIRDGIDGILVEPGSVESLRNALIYLIEDKERRIDMSENAYHTALENFDLNKNVESYYRQYRLLAGSKN